MYELTKPFFMNKNGEEIYYCMLDTNKSISFDSEFAEKAIDVLNICATAEIIGFSEDDEEFIEKAGEFECKIFDVQAHILQKGKFSKTLHFAADSVSTDDSVIISSVEKLIEMNHIPPYLEKVFVLNSISVEKELRGNNLGSEILSGVRHLVNFFNLDFAIAQLAPIEDLPEGISKEEYIANLRAFYEKNHFKCYEMNGITLAVFRLF